MYISHMIYRTSGTCAQAHTRQTEKEVRRSSRRGIRNSRRRSKRKRRRSIWSRRGIRSRRRRNGEGTLKRKRRCSDGSGR